jgi:hypothetical protein
MNSSHNIAIHQTSYSLRLPLAGDCGRSQGPMNMLNFVRKIIRKIIRGGVPAVYDPKMHYNCMVEALPREIRQPFYHQMLNMGYIRESHRLPDGRLQLVISTNLDVCFDVLRSIGAGDPHAYRVNKTDLIKLMLSKPDVPFVFITKTGKHMHHAETHRPSELTLKSEKALGQGVACHKKKDYGQAVQWYNKAIESEPLDFRAWNNKIVALSQSEKDNEAIQVADGILTKHPDIAILWATKAYVLNKMGQGLEAGECLSQAMSLDEEVKSAFRPDNDIDAWLQDIRNAAKEINRDPDTDVRFWIGAHEHYVSINDSEKALLCLQMAARIGEGWGVMRFSEGFQVMTPSDFRFAKDMGCVESLRDFYLRLANQKVET